ncbi:MAG: FMN-binding glutamate synthase family protein [Candidatus Methanomethyliales bacterium]|nr:FMN-binding glutamate synthase family protein [Candidatus Methanomethylicales archaeon]
MAHGRPGASAATATTNRIRDVSPFSGMCVVCEEGCPGLCEVGRSAYRGREVIYPQPFGKATAASQKDYPVDFSHLTILGETLYTEGIEEGKETIFPNVNIETELDGIRLRNPIVISAMGSTEVARRNWEGLAGGAAISGCIAIVGENVCGMDMDAEWDWINNKVIRSPDMEFRVRAFRDWYDGYGEIGVQLNPHDAEFGVGEYVASKLEVNLIEIKRGQGAKDIGGEVKVDSLEKALELKKRGYFVYPDPEDKEVQEAYRSGLIRAFERHSKTPQFTREGFLELVDRLRGAGVKHISFKDGPYRPFDIAYALRLGSMTELSFMTFDGAGGGTGMSPWRMMNEWGIPTYYLESLIHGLCCFFEYERMLIPPPLVIAGGITLEDHVVKALSLGAPYIRAVGMSRAPLAAVMVAKTLVRQIKEKRGTGTALGQGKPADTDRSDPRMTLEGLFVTAQALKEKYGQEYIKLVETGAIGVYTYIQDRLATGIKQLLCGLRKFDIGYLSRDDVAALTKEAEEVANYYPKGVKPSGFKPLRFVTDVDLERISKL